MASGRVEFECWALAALINKKYPCLETMATALCCESFVVQAFQEDVVNSVCSLGSNGNHHGFALTEV